MKTLTVSANFGDLAILFSPNGLRKKAEGY